MKERPILFSAPMVRAILAGTKTQTRRVVKPPKGYSCPNAMKTWTEVNWRTEDGTQVWIVRKTGDMAGPSFKEMPCPYGKKGDRLWVREAFIHSPADYVWEASVSIPCRPAQTVYRADFGDEVSGAGWTPSIHMPRELSRIDLEVTDVRIERLKDCSEVDAKEEGCGPAFEDEHGIVGAQPSYRYGYAKLWESINGPGSWDANPWVWVVEFRRIGHADQA